MKNIELKAAVAKKWYDDAWDRAFDPFLDNVAEHVREQHYDRIAYDIAGSNPGLSAKALNDKVWEALNPLITAEIDKDGAAALDEHMEATLPDIEAELREEYFRNYRLALDGAAPEHECWKVLSEYGVNAANLLELHPES